MMVRRFFSGEERAMMVSHALGINLEGNGNEILLTREQGGVR